jgi:hypothetical protein
MVPLHLLRQVSRAVERAETVRRVNDDRSQGASTAGWRMPAT